MVSAVRSMARLLQEFRRQTPWLIAIGVVYEAVNELEEKEKQLPSWNRRGGPKGRGGSEVEMVVFESTTPSLFLFLLLLLLLQFIHNFYDRP